MSRIGWISLVTAALLATPLACRKAETPKVETKSETKSTNADGSKTTTTTETKQIGSTLAATTETKGGGPKGGRTESETVVGTVTDFGPGKRIVVLTGDGTKHSYDLDDKKTVSSIDPRVAVGTKVQLDSTKDNDGRRSVRVVPVAGR